jgi:hypothetical protein
MSSCEARGNGGLPASSCQYLLLRCGFPANLLGCLLLGSATTFASCAQLSCRPAWVPQAQPSPLHVVDACSLGDDVISAKAEVRQYLDPAARWRQCVSSGGKQQLLEFLATGGRNGACSSSHTVV